MSNKGKIVLGWVVVIVFYLLRYDFWFWGSIEPMLFGWMPPAAWYHILYAFLAIPVMYVFVTLAWPKNE